jgi:serine/threonine-protein kinase
MFIAMACYDGETLKKRIERGPLKLEDAIDISLQISEGLSKAHDNDIVHRDLKPANVMLTKDDVVKILDFGLAKLRGQTKLTTVGTTLGTAPYMSPEQARGEEVDNRTDVFSLGVLLYEMLSGQLPFKGDYHEAIIYSILNEDQEPITGLK